jgi:Spy/CpxP family protein refolding chaperone
MTNKLLGITILGVALSAAAILPAGAEPQAGTGLGRGGERHLQRLVDYVGLSADQQTAWKSLFERHQADTVAMRQEGRELHQRLHAAVTAENPDPTTVGSATLALKKHRSKAKAAHEAFETELKSTLTPDQKVKFEAFKAAHHRHARGAGRRGQEGTPAAPPNPEAPVKG